MIPDTRCPVHGSHLVLDIFRYMVEFYNDFYVIIIKTNHENLELANALIGVQE